MKKFVLYDIVLSGFDFIYLKYNTFLILHVIVVVYKRIFFLGGIFFLVTKYSGGIFSRRHFFHEAFFL